MDTATRIEAVEELAREVESTFIGAGDVYTTHCALHASDDGIVPSLIIESAKSLANIRNGLWIGGPARTLTHACRTVTQWEDVYDGVPVVVREVRAHPMEARP